MNRQGITVRLALAFVLFALVPVYFLGGWMMNIHRKSIIEAVSASLAEIADKKADQIEDYIGDCIKNIRILSNMRGSADDFDLMEKAFYQTGVSSPAYKAAEEKIRFRYARFIEIGKYHDLFFISSRGDVIFTLAHEGDLGTNLVTGPYRDTGLARVFDTAIHSLEADFSQYQIYGPSNIPAVFMAAPLISDGKALGVVAAQVGNKQFSQVVTDNTGLGETGETVVARMEGDHALFLLPLRHDPDAAFKRKYPIADKSAPPITHAVTGERGNGEARDYRHVEIIAAWRYVPSARIGIVVKIDSAEALAGADRLRQQGYYALACVLGLMLLAAVYIGRSIVHPLLALQRVTTAIAKGDISRRAEVTSSDEVGQLASSFNQMAAKLEDDIREMGKKDRIMRMLSDCNQTLIRVTDEMELLQAICGIITHVGWYKMAWVGYREEGGEKRVLPIAQAGFEDGYLDSATVTWGDDERGRGPTGTAIKTRKPSFMNDIANNPDYAPWRAEAMKRGYASCIAIPLMSGDEALGSLNIYSSEKYAFDAEETKLLQELGGDLAFGIMVIRGQMERRKAEAALKESEAKHRSLIENISDCVCHIGLDGKIIYMNPAGRVLHGIRGDVQIEGLDCAFNIDKKFVGPMRAAIADASSGIGITTRLEYMSLDGSGAHRWWYSTVNPIRNQTGDVVSIVRIDRDMTKKRRIEENLRKSAKEIEDLYNNAPCGYHSLDKDGVFLRINDTELAWIGYTRDEVIGKMKLTDVLTPASVQSFRENFPKLAKQGFVHDVEVAIIRRNGTEINGLINTTAIYDDSGGFVMSRTTIYDITERKRVEEALRQSELKFRTIFDSTSEAVMLLDEKGFLDCNKATLGIFGCATREEFCSKHPADLSPPSQPCGTDSMTLANKHIATAMEKGSHSFEWTHMRADNGKAFPAEVLLNAMTLDGKPILEAVVRDIAGRKRAEADLRESEEKYHALFQKHMDMILVYDAATRVVEDVNQACIETYGYSKEEFLKLTVKDITASWDETEKALDELLDGTVGDSFGEVRIPVMYAKRKDGSIFPLELGLNHFFSSGRKKIVISSRDITDAVLTEKNMRAQRRHLVQADKLRSLGTLVAGVAHEINNPNSFIMFNGPMIRKAWDGVMPILEKYYEEHGEFSAGGMPFTRLRNSAPRLIDDMLAGSRRINKIVDKLKGFARQSEGEIHKPVDINRVLKDAAWLLSPLIGKSTRLFITNYAESLPPVMGDMGALEQVAVNLVSNALQSLKSEEDMVRVSTRFDAGSNCVILEVRDEGVGVPPGQLDKIMDPFYTTKREKGGMGLGLSISYGIIQEHKGTIKFESEDRMGTTVTVSLPAHLEQ